MEKEEPKKDGYEYEMTFYSHSRIRSLGGQGFRLVGIIQAYPNINGGLHQPALLFEKALSTEAPSEPAPQMEELILRKDAAIKDIEEYGMIDGAHHKQWLLDRTLRTLLGDADYHEWVATHNSDDDYEDWDVGIAP